jgi:hypothetical protein
VWEAFDADDTVSDAIVYDMCDLEFEHRQDDHSHGRCGGRIYMHKVSLTLSSNDATTRGRAEPHQ